MPVCMRAVMASVRVVALVVCLLAAIAALQGIQARPTVPAGAVYRRREFLLLSSLLLTYLRYEPLRER